MFKSELEIMKSPEAVQQLGIRIFSLLVILGSTVIVLGVTRQNFAVILVGNGIMLYFSLLLAVFFYREFHPPCPTDS